MRYRDGDWNGSEFILKKSGSIRLADGSVQSVTFYRSNRLVNSRNELINVGCR